MKRNSGAVVSGLLVAMAVFAADARAQAEEAERDRRDVAQLDATKGHELDRGQWMLVRVSNSVQPARSVIVSVINPTRPEYVLGAVPPGETREWKIDTRLYVGSVRFLARSPRGSLVNSVRAVSQARADWNLGLNFMRYKRLDDAEIAEIETLDSN